MWLLGPRMSIPMFECQRRVGLRSWSGGKDMLLPKTHFCRAQLRCPPIDVGGMWHTVKLF